METKTERGLYYGRKKRREINKDLSIGDRVKIMTCYGKLDVSGKVLDLKEDFFLVQTRNYKECFSWYELGRVVYKV